jgi:protein O-GlcNAc transferase
MNTATPTKNPAQEIEALREALVVHESGELAEAERRYREILLLNPSSADAVHFLGMVLHQQQKASEEVLMLLLQARNLNQKNTTYLANTASVLIDRGESEKAIPMLRQVLDAQPESIEALVNLGKAYLQLDQPASAVTPLYSALSQRPDSAEIQNMLGLAYLRTSNIDAAIESLRSAVNADPNHALAHANLGYALLQKGKSEEATHHFEISGKLRPTGELYYYRAAEKWKHKLPLEAMSLCQDALAIKPGLLEAHQLCAELYRLAGDIEKSRAHYGAILNDASPPDIALQAATLTSPIARDAASQAAAKEDIAFNISYLIDHLPIEQSLRKVYSAFAVPHFFLDDGEDAGPLAAALFKFYQHIFPQLLYRAPHLTAAKQSTKPVVGIYAPPEALGKSVFVAAKNALSVIESETPIEAWLLTGSGSDVSQFGHDERTVLLDDRLEYAREQISALKLDVLLFVEIGTEPLGYFLSFARLAKTQVLLAGCPVAKGVDNFEYRIVVGDIEPLAAASFRPHELITLKHAYELAAPEVLASNKTRADLGLPPSGNPYFCPAPLSTLHPSFDEVIQKLLLLDPAAHIVFFADAIQQDWARLLKERLIATGVSDSQLARVSFLPRPNQADVSAIYAHSAVVLDPFKVSLGEALTQAFVAGTPAVTFPSELAMGRTGQYYCGIVGIEDCVVDNVEAYVTKALQIANDAAVRSELTAKMAANLPLLFNSPDSRAELVDVVSKMLDIKKT